jgi:hypothetical protein
MLLDGMDPDTEILGGFGGRSRVGFGMNGVCVTLVECKSDLDRREWMQLVDDLAVILGH